MPTLATSETASETVMNEGFPRHNAAQRGRYENGPTDVAHMRLSSHYSSECRGRVVYVTFRSTDPDIELAAALAALRVDIQNIPGSFRHDQRSSSIDCIGWRGGHVTRPRRIIGIEWQLYRDVFDANSFSLHHIRHQWSHRSHAAISANYFARVHRFQ
jgi:hypothetical protein